MDQRSSTNPGQRRNRRDGNTQSGLVQSKDFRGVGFSDGEKNGAERILARRKNQEK